MSVFPLSRAMERGNLHSTGISRFIAKPVPVPLQGGRLNTFCYVVCSYSGAIPKNSLHARMAPLWLFDSMRSETPGAREPLSYDADSRTTCASVKTIGSHPNLPVLGAMCQIQGMHPSPRRTPTAYAAVPGGWIDLTRKGFSDAHRSGIFSPLR